MDESKPVDLDRLTAPFPKEAHQTRQGGGGKALTYLATHSVIHRLNDATVNRWDFRLTRFELIGDTYVAIGELSIPGLGTRTGIGVQKVAERSGEDLIKGVASDCLKKCATLFGVGLELYGPDYEAGEIEDQAPKNGRPNPPQSRNVVPETLGNDAEQRLANDVRERRRESPEQPAPATWKTFWEYARSKGVKTVAQFTELTGRDLPEVPEHALNLLNKTLRERDAVLARATP